MAKPAQAGPTTRRPRVVADEPGGKGSSKVSEALDAIRAKLSVARSIIEDAREEAKAVWEKTIDEIEEGDAAVLKDELEDIAGWIADLEPEIEEED